MQAAERASDVIDPTEPAWLPPPSLTRRGPERIELTVGSGKAVKYFRGSIRLVAGQSLIVRVVFDKPLHGANCETFIEGSDALLPIMRTSRIVSGNRVIYHSEFRSRLYSQLPEWIRGKIPLPCHSKIHVRIADAISDPVRIDIPVSIRPSFGAIGTICLFVPFFFVIVPELVRRYERMGNIWDGGLSLLESLDIWKRCGTLAIATAMALGGLLVVALGIGGGEEE